MHNKARHSRVLEIEESMDISKILGDLKGKVLDAAHFELLKHAYDLQEENIKQLKTNNDALRENNQLLADEIAALKLIKNGIESENKLIKAMFPNDDIELSDEAEAVLDVYLKKDGINLYQAWILSESGLTTIQTQSGITELQEKGFLTYGRRNRGGEVLLSLQPRGQKILSKKQKNL